MGRASIPRIRRGGSAYRSSPVSAARRSNPFAASEFADGVASSNRSLGRTTSASASCPVVKKPPASASWNRREQLVGDGAGIGQPREVVELGHRQQRFEQRGVVLGVREVGRLPRAKEPTVVATQLAQQEPRVGARRLHPVVAVERRRGFRERGEEQRVPAEQHLVVEARPHALVATREQEGPAPLDGGRLGLGPRPRRAGCCRRSSCAGRRSSRLGDAEVAVDFGARRRRTPPESRRVTTGRTCPRCPRSRRLRRSRSRRPGR